MKNMLSFQAEIYATNVAVKEIILFYFLSTLSKAISYCFYKAQKSIETGLHNRQKAAYVLTEQENNSLQWSKIHIAELSSASSAKVTSLHESHWKLRINDKRNAFLLVVNVSQRQQLRSYKEVERIISFGRLSNVTTQFLQVTGNWLEYFYNSSGKI